MSEFECEKCGCPDKCAEGVLEGVIEERDDLAARLAEAEAKVARVEALAATLDECPCPQTPCDLVLVASDIRRALDGTR